MKNPSPQIRILVLFLFYASCFVSHKRIEPKQNFSDINIKTLPKNCRNLSISLKCFDCIYYHWKKNSVQSFYVKRGSLLSLPLCVHFSSVMHQNLHNKIAPSRGLFFLLVAKRTTMAYVLRDWCWAHIHFWNKTFLFV